MNEQIYLDPLARFLGDWAFSLNAYSALLRVSLACICAAIVGCERAHKRHSAGMRTFILVATASSIAMLLDLFCGEMLHAQWTLISASSVIGIAIVSGNSFLYSSKNQIKGLTTAIALWASGFIGLAFGGGFYTVALIGFVALLVCLSALPPVENYLKDRSNHFEVHLELKNKTDLQDFITTIRRLGLKIDDIESNPAYLGTGLSVFSISITITREELKKYQKHREIIEALSTLEYVSFIEEIL